MSEDATDGEPQRKRRGKQRSFWGLLGPIFAACVFLIGYTISRFLGAYDNSASNVAFAIGTLFSLTIFYFWLLRRRAIPIVARILIAVTPLVFALVFVAMYRFEGFNAELVPQFRSRSSVRSQSISSEIASQPAGTAQDGQLEPGTSPASRTEPLQDIAAEFTSVSSSQFFGDSRDGKHPDIGLTTDWQSNPPEELWRIPIGNGWSSFAVKDGIAVTMEQPADTDIEQLLAVRLDNGKPLWVAKTQGTHFHPMGGHGPRTTPVIHDRTVIGLSSIGKVIAADLVTGDVLWQRDLLKDTKLSQVDFEKFVSWARSGSPLVVSDKVIVPLGGDPAQDLKTLAAFDIQSGEIAWTNGNDQISYSSPQLLTIDGVQQIVQVSEMHVAGYSPENGALLWNHPWASKSSGDASTSQVAQIDDTSLLLSKGYLRGCERIDVRQDNEFWTVSVKWSNSKSLKTKLTSAIVHEGFAYGLNDGKLECVDLETGKRKWMKGRFGHGQVILSGDKLLISSEDGELIVVATEPENMQELARIKVVDGVTWNIPTLAGNLLIIRNPEEAVCLRLPVEQAEEE